MTLPTNDTDASSDPALLERAVRRTLWRLMPMLLLMYILAYLDRVNLGFAKQAYLRDTGLSEAAYAFGAGIFFIGYAVLEVPSNLILHRVGARWWLSRIMVSWGLVAAAMAYAESEYVFYFLRFLLGITEAGFFPGVVYYLTYWFPHSVRGRAMGIFYFGPSLALSLGGPLSGLLLEMDSIAGYRGWQWMFLVEGLLASVVGVVAFFVLHDRPSEARWLPSDERGAIEAAIAKDSANAAHSSSSVLSALVRPRILSFATVYFLIQMSVYGVIFYLPSTLSALIGRPTGWEVGVLSAIPWIGALVASYTVPRFAGAGDRRGIVGAASLTAASIGIAASASGDPFLGIVALCVAAAGFIAVQPIFWTFPTHELRGAAAAGAIGLINALGNLGGFVAPNVRVWAENFAAERSLSIRAPGLVVLALTTLLGAVLFLLLARFSPGRVDRSAPKL
ncbi:MAG: MFS transporter [Verrucomicrobia bacterium]|nr:MFS transporter [Verrucomicrobiota bacterium]